jgi:hypothetical protein
VVRAGAVLAHRNFARRLACGVPNPVTGQTAAQMLATPGNVVNANDTPPNPNDGIESWTETATCGANLIAGLRQSSRR